MDNPYFDFTKKEVIDALGMSEQTFYKYFADIEKYDIVNVSIRIGRARLYKINIKDPLVAMLRAYETKLSLQMAEKEMVKMKKPVAVKSR